MDPRVERLLQLVHEARRERGLVKQLDFVERTGLGRTTIQRLQRGERLSETAYRSIDWALGWVAGSCIAVLNGGEPTVADTRPASAPDEPPRLPPLADRLPKLVLKELEDGVIYAVETYDLTQDGGLRLVAVAIRDPDKPPMDPEQLRRETRAWLRTQRRLRGMAPLPWEPGDPVEDELSENETLDDQ